MTIDTPGHVTTMKANNSPDPAKAGKLAQQIVGILIDEDSATRQRAIQAAMMLLGETTPPQGGGQAGLTDGEIRSDDHTTLAAFFNREGNMKPADHAQLCAAYHYSVYGAAAFSIAELKAIATDAGVVLPDRVDMTLRNAMHKGKKLFQVSVTGGFKPTAAACLLFAEKWKVKPGKKAKPAEKSGPDA